MLIGPCFMWKERVSLFSRETTFGAKLIGFAIRERHTGVGRNLTFPPLGGSLHRGWLNIKSVITGKDDHAIVAEAERGEDVAKTSFENALSEPLPGSAHTLGQQEAAKVRQAHDDVRRLRDIAK